MQTRKISTITSNEDQVRVEICSGVLPIDKAGEELLRVERAQHAAERQRHQDTRERLGAALIGAHRTIWMLIQENGGCVILNKDTKESYPGDAVALIEQTDQPENGCTIFRAALASVNQQKTGEK